MKTIIVTGAGGGLGIRLVAELRRQLTDAALICQYRTRGGRELSMLDVRMICADVGTADADGARATVQLAIDTGDLWGVINLAGGNASAPIREVTPDAFLDAFRQNVITAHNINRAAVPHMLRGGRIINVSSVVARMGAHGATPYATAKAALEGYTRSLALEVARHKITVNCLRLGYFSDGLISQVPEAKIAEIVTRTAVRRLGDPGLELASAVRFLLGEDSGFITGQVLEVAGGLV